MGAAWLVVGLLAATPAPELYRLDNGMWWVLLQQGAQPRVAGAVVVNAGSVHEQPGEAGVAHFLEHLAFKGTPITGPRVEWRLERELLDEVLRLVERQVDAEERFGPASPAVMKLETALVSAERDWEEQGDADAFPRLLGRLEASWNASTSSDHTVYWADFPTERLAAWCTAEAQRFAAPVFREFRTERKVVLQERLDRETPATDSTAALFQLAFGDARPLQTLGTPEGLRRLRPSTVDGFYARLYSPSNAVGALVGQFDPVEAKRWLSDTFGRIPARAVDSAATLRPAPFGTRTVAGVEPRVLIGLPLPPRAHPRWAIETLARRRLDLVLKARCVRAAKPCAHLEHVRGPGSWRAAVDVFIVTPSEGSSPAAVLDWFFDSVAATPVTADESAALEMGLQVELAATCATRRGRAEAVAASLLHSGKPGTACMAPGAVNLEALRAATVSIDPARAWVIIQEAR